MTKEFTIENLDLDISREELKECLEFFGSVASVELEPGSGRAFIRYDKKADAQLAVKSLEGFDFIGNELRISRTGNKKRSSRKIAS